VSQTATPSEAMKSPFWKRFWLGGVCVAILGWLLTVNTLDPSGSYPESGQGPGITLDESFNVQQGVLLVEAFRVYGPFLFDPYNLDDVFGGKAVPYLPDHPPLGRWILGIAHHICWMWNAPESPAPSIVTACARTGSAAMFGLTLLLIGLTAGRWYGPLAGWIAPLSVLLMPRVFAHAHIASLESTVNFTYALAVLGMAHLWSHTWKSDSIGADQAPNRFGSWQAGLIPGFLLGLAMLSKIQGFLLVPGCIVWALWYGRQRAILPLFVWGVIGWAVFFAGWPWLWLDPVGHLQEFLGSATDRVTLHNFYLGHVYDDNATPWHYPWLMFLLTVPLGLQLLGILGTKQAIQNRRAAPAAMLVLLSILFPMLLFSTGVATYDGVRLFLMVFPLWGILIGSGAETAWQWLQARIAQPQLRIGLASLLLLTQAWGVWVTHPCQLSYFNLLAFGQSSDEPTWEACYWGDSITREFLQECTKVIPAGSTVEIAPTLHQFQCGEMNSQSPIVQSQKWTFLPYPQSQLQGDRFVLVFLRYADLTDVLPELREEFTEERSFSRNGRKLAVLFRSQSQE